MRNARNKQDKCMIMQEKLNKNSMTNAGKDSNMQEQCKTIQKLYMTNARTNRRKAGKGRKKQEQ